MSLRSARSALMAVGSSAQRVVRGRRRSSDSRLRRLIVAQEGRTLRIEVSVTDEWRPIDLVARCAALPERWVDLLPFRKANATGKANEVQAAVDLDALAQLAEAAQGAGLGVDDPDRRSDDSRPGLLIKLYLRVQCMASAMPDNALQVQRVDGAEEGRILAKGDEPLDNGKALAAAVERGTVAGQERWSGLVPLGRFADTEVGTLGPIRAGDHDYRPYVGRRGYLHVAVDRPVKPFAAVYVDALSVDGGQLRMTGRVLSRHSDISGARVVLVGRTTGGRLEAPAQVAVMEQATRHGFGLRHHRLRAKLDIAAQPVNRVAADEILDAWLEFSTQDSGAPHRARIGNTPYLVRKSVRAGWRVRGDKTIAITPYFTFKAKRVSFHVDVLDADGFELLHRGARRRKRAGRKSAAAGRPVWLIGERPYKAQDTGVAFFRYMREHHPEIDAYYVIDRESAEVKNLVGLDHVIWHRSKEHVELALRADRFIGSHHPDYLYPTWLPQFRKVVRGTKVFLQHGVMGTKWMVPNYGKNAPGFDTDLFLVSSEREKEYIVGDFGYDPDDVTVTGLSRFDSLFANDVPVNRNQILVIPTWRDWLQDAATFEDSDYLKQWQLFLRHPRFRALTSAHRAEVVLCLHPNMQQFRDHFDEPGVRIISQGEVDVQHLIKQSAIMITDYSSVGFDFAFLDKPVIYFQFDRERFLGRNGSHIDLDTELPGPSTFQADALIDLVADSLESGGVMGSEYARRADRFIGHRDRNNCERIFAAIRSARPRQGIDTIVDPELLTTATKRFRRSRGYFPTMRRLFTLWRTLPVDPNLILFESGLGTQYADSPRYIYEELVRRGDPRKKVWVYSGKLPVRDRNTITVRRLSPEYYWYLARAKYWVNNQNFPHYIRRRADGIFIQTWHGTPLKRMQHDLWEVHGRDSAYLDRVTAAMEQWSVLLSPSSYATKAFRSAFRYEGPILEAGYPRNDVLADPNRSAAIRHRVRRRLGLAPDSKAVLYAPTFRDDHTGSREGRFRFELPFELEDFANSLSDDTVLLLRTHVLIENDIVIPQDLRHRVFDVSSYPEIQELYLASDALITDYSSVFFDYAILRRPMIFYAYDIQRYRDHLRGFYLDYESDVPGPIVETPSELWGALRQALNGSRRDVSRLDAFATHYAPLADGLSAQRVVDELM